jgi:predicted permease
VLLGLLGGVGGIVLARFAGGALRALLLPDADAAAVLSDGRTLVWSMALAVLAGLLTGVMPSLAAGRTDVATSLKEGGRGSTHRRSLLRASLVVTQAALSLVLLVGAGLFVRSLSRAQDHRLGIDVEPVLYAEANMRGVRLDQAAGRALMQRMMDEARGTPGVASVTMAASVPFWSNEGRALYVPGVDSLRRLGRFTLQAGTADYFTTTGTRILRGRGFTDADREGAAPVIVVSDAMARAVWPGRDAIGQCVRVNERQAPCRTVVGIAEETAMNDLQPTRQYTYYLPVEQFLEAISPQFFVRVRGEPNAVIPALRTRMQAVMPGAAYVRVVPLSDLITPQLRAWRFGATMFVAFGGLALVLAALGMYSLVSYEVAQREKELGVRLALGAPLGTLVMMVVGRGARLATIGLFIGLLVALGGGRLVESLLFQQSPRDAGVIVTVGTMLLVVAVLASLFPAVRAMRTDPNRVLRAD